MLSENGAKFQCICSQLFLIALFGHRLDAFQH